MRLDELPRRLGIIGGGYVAAEFAHVFSSFGVEVTLIARSDRLLRHEDAEIAERFTEIAREVDLRRARHRRRLAERRRQHPARDAQPEAGRPGSWSTSSWWQSGARTRDTLNLEPPASRSTTRVSVVSTSTSGPPSRASSRWATFTHPQLKHVANHEARVVQHNLLNPTDGSQRPPLRPARRVQLTADRGRRPHRTGGGEQGLDSLMSLTSSTRYRLRLGDGGHQPLRQDPRRPGDRADHRLPHRSARRRPR